MLGFKKHVSLLLLLGLLCTTFPLASCASGESDKDTTTTQAIEQSQTTTDEASALLSIPDDLPVKDYEGKPFRIMVRDNVSVTM